MLQQQTGDSVLPAETLRLASQRYVGVNNTLAQTRRHLARMTSSRRDCRSRCMRNRALRPNYRLFGSGSGDPRLGLSVALMDCSDTANPRTDLTVESFLVGT
jgi:hypothetical protein